jgi:hypothetical protein
VFGAFLTLPKAAPVSMMLSPLVDFESNRFWILNRSQTLPKKSKKERKESERGMVSAGMNIEELSSILSILKDMQEKLKCSVW